MKAWWVSRTDRERVLLSIMGGLVGVFVLWFGVAGPVMDQRQRAETRFARAAADLAFVQDAVLRVSPAQGAIEAGGPSAASSQQSVRAIVGATHSAAGLVVDAVTPSGDDEAAVRLDAAQPAVLFAWLEQLQRDHGVVVLQASVRRSARDDTVTANLTLGRR